MADAVAKAGQLAELAGVKLGNPLYITESMIYPTSIYRGYAEAAAPMAGMETPISPGEMEITMNVQVTYEILD
jgi:uncharacterized protein YggE